MCATLFRAVYFTRSRSLVRVQYCPPPLFSFLLDIRSKIVSEENKRLVNRIFDEAISSGIYDVIDELIAPNYVSHGLPMSINGPQGLRQSIETFRSAFPDLYMLVEEQIADGDQVSNQGYITGTHRGEFLGVPASGEQIKVNVISIWRFENSKVVENWVQIDYMSLMRQIGAVTG